MDKKNEINVMIHLPQKEADQKELSARVARAHADAVLTYLKKLNCPIEQIKTTRKTRGLIKP